MLSDAQITQLADKINEKVNIPILSERREQKIIENLLRRVDDEIAKHLPPALQDIWNKLDDGINAAEAEELGDELTKLINEKLDIPLLNEQQEEKVLGTIVDLVMEVVQEKVNEGIKKALD